MNRPVDPRFAVDVRGVSRTYPGGVTALVDVDLTVGYGETVAITGPSGCGKSTLLNLLAAIDSPSCGTVTVGGQNLARVRDLSEYRRYEVGLIFQFHNLLPQLPALSNVELAMFGGHRSARQRRARARELLAAVDLGDREHRLPTELSGGERQRVAIARALANEPKILLADEPTGSLDSASTERFLDLLKHLGDTGMTVVMVTHDSEVAEHAHRTIEMCDGAIVSGRTAPSSDTRAPDGWPHSEHVRPGVG
jgi:putative ABC transport system ATP-binding protein